MTPEEMTPEIGYISELVKGGVLGKVPRRAAATTAAKGLQQPGYLPNYRLTVLREVQRSAPRIDDVMRGFMDAVPTFHEEIGPHHEKTMRDAQDLFTDLDPEVSQMIGQTRAPLSAWTTEISKRLEEALRETQAWKEGKLRDIAYLLTDTDGGVSSKLGERSRELERIEKQGTYIGVPSLVAARISRSVVCRMLRTLLAEKPALSVEIDAMALNPFDRHAYKLEAAERSNYNMFKKSLRRTAQANLSARTHALIGPALEGASQMEWPRSRGGERYPDDLTLMHLFPEAAIMHQRIADPAPSDILIFGDHMVTVPDCLRTDERGDREPLCLTTQDGQWLPDDETPYAEIDWSLLPAGSLETLERTVRGLRTTMHLLLRRPQVAAAVRQFPSLELTTHPEGLFCRVEDADIPGLAAVFPGAQIHTQETAGTRRTTLAVSFAPEEDRKEKENEVEDEPERRLTQAVREALGEMTTFQKLDRLMKALGLERVDSGGKGSHIKYVNHASGHAAILSHRYSESANTDVPVGIVASSLKSAKLLPEQLGRLDAALMSF